jgi:hypothetical protein
MIARRDNEQWPTIRSRTLYQGDQSVWFVSDYDATFPSNTTLSDEDIESLNASLTGVTDTKYGPFVTFEPDPC